jgi:hypothetical protein
VDSARVLLDETRCDVEIELGGELTEVLAGLAVWNGLRLRMTGRVCPSKIHRLWQEHDISTLGGQFADGAFGTTEVGFAGASFDKGLA